MNATTTAPSDATVPAAPPPTPFRPPYTPAGVPLDRVGEVAAWLDACERELVHAARVEECLRREGWSPAQAAAVGRQYRARFNQHSLGYASLLVATGLAALAAGTAGHLAAAGIDGPVNRNLLGEWLTVLVCSLPFAVWAHRWAAKADADDPVAVWSGPRRALAQVLLWSCGIIGVGRLVVYVGQLIGVLVGATWAQGVSVLTGAVNVSITVGIALPLGLWAYRFLHRFDEEDPTAPVDRHRPTGR
jgi:hypothetical protein